MPFADFTQHDLQGKRVLLRVDFNVPMREGEIVSVERLLAIKETLSCLRERGARVALLSHFGRPKGNKLPQYSLKHILPCLEKLLNSPIVFVVDCVGKEVERAVNSLPLGGICLLENVRFYREEEENNLTFARKLAENFDLYINDAFSVCHRAHASTVGVTEFLPSFAGCALKAELEALRRFLHKAKRPIMALVAGSKISTKLALLTHLIEKMDKIFIGGAMANSFWSAQGFPVGASLHEEDLKQTVVALLAQAKKNSCKLILPVDGIAAEKLQENTACAVVAKDKVESNQMILDIGPQTIALLKQEIDSTATLLWNGPLGAFEVAPFGQGTKEIAQYVGKRVLAGHLEAVAGGGDTIAAVSQAVPLSDFSYISTGGGAFLTWLEGKTLPAVSVLQTE